MLREGRSRGGGSQADLPTHNGAAPGPWLKRDGVLERACSTHDSSVGLTAWITRDFAARALSCKCGRRVSKCVVRGRCRGAATGAETRAAASLSAPSHGHGVHQARWHNETDGDYGVRSTVYTTGPARCKGVEKKGRRQYTVAWVCD
jgi:hypothetical protein